MTEYDPRITPWLIDSSEFYELEDTRAQLEFLLRYAVLAPSGHNTQPWSFRITSEGIEVYSDPGRRLPIIDPADRELLMSVGAAITNLRVAAAHFGFETTVLYQPRLEESLPVALVAIRETCCPEPSLTRLFSGITARHTNRQPFEEKPIDEGSLSKLCDFVDEHPEWVQFILPHDRPHAAELIAEGDRLLMKSEGFRSELASWLRPNETRAGDGICGDALGLPGPAAALAPWVMRHFDLGRTQARADRSFAEHAAGLIAVVADDDRTSLIRAGEILERLLLLLTTLKIAYSFLNQPIEIDRLRNELWSMIRCPKPPQLLLRFGYARPVDHAQPRRPLEAVLVP